MVLLGILRQWYQGRRGEIVIVAVTISPLASKELFAACKQRARSADHFPVNLGPRFLGDVRIVHNIVECLQLVEITSRERPGPKHAPVGGLQFNRMSLGNEWVAE